MAGPWDHNGGAWAEHHPVCRRCLSLVHRGHTRSSWGIGRSFFCNCILRKRSVVPGNVVCFSSGDRRDDLHRRFRSTDRADQFDYVPFCARVLLHRHQRLCDQNGRRIHDIDINRDRLHPGRTTMDCNRRIRLSLVSACRQLLRRLEYRPVANMGSPSQQPSPNRESSPLIRRTDVRRVRACRAHGLVQSERKLDQGRRGALRAVSLKVVWFALLPSGLAGVTGEQAAERYHAVEAANLVGKAVGSQQVADVSVRADNS